MGRFFTSTQIYNPKQLDRDGFKADFCKKMKKESYEVCEADCAELSYVLAFADNCKWVTLSSEAYEQGNRTAQAGTARIAKMLGTYCVNTIVIDSDCAMLDLYDDKGKKADTLVMGRADDYLGDDIPAPAKAVWEQFLSADSTWDKFMSVVQGDYVFVEDGLSELAPVIEMASGNILFEYEDADENDENICYLSFRKASFKKEKKLTLNSAFVKVFGEDLEPLGFVKIKSKHPYFVRVVNEEILHIITFDKDYPGEFSVFGGIATVYRKKIDFDQDVLANLNAMNDTAQFYAYSFKDYSKDDTVFRERSYCYLPNDNDSIEQTFIKALDQAKQYILPVLDSIVSLRGCIDHYMVYHSPIINIISDEYDRECRNEGLLYFKIDDHSDMIREFSKSLEVTKKMIKKDRHYDSVLAMRCVDSEEYRMELISKRDAIYNDPVVYQQVMAELERRKQFNIEKLKSYGIDFEKTQPKKEKKLTLNSAFVKVFGEALVPLGFKKVKSKYPYFAKIVNDEILQVVTIVSRPDKRFEILGGIATVYRQSLSLDLNPKMNESWLIGNFHYYQQLDITNEERKHSSNEIYEFYGADWLEKEMKRAFNATKEIILDILAKVNSLEKCVEFYNFFEMDIRIHHKDDFGNSYPINYYNEGLLIIKTMNLEQYSSLMDRYKEITINRRKKQITNGGIPYERLMNEQEVFKNQKVSEYKDLLDDKEWLATVDIELNKRRNHNIRLLEEYGLI